MKVRLWGVRGSTPTPEKGNGRYGGNTACVEIRLENNTLIILDCGTGLRALGKSLSSEFAGRDNLSGLLGTISVPLELK